MKNKHENNNFKNSNDEEDINISKILNQANIDDIDKGKNDLDNIKITEHLSEDFKNNLAKMMTEEYEKEDSKLNIKNAINNIIVKEQNDNNTDKNYEKINRNKNKYTLPKKLAIAFCCFIVISSAVFGKNFKSMVSHIFSNQDKSLDLAIENGYYQNVDMDYIVNDGIGIKIDYVYADDTCIYVAFNVYAKEEFDVISINEIEIKTENDDLLYNANIENVYYESNVKLMSKSNAIIISKFYRIQDEFVNFANLKINISQISYKNNNEQKTINNNWNFYTNIDKNISSEEINYALNSQELVDNYSIRLNSNKLRLKLKFKKLNINNKNINRNNIYLEDYLGNKYYSNDWYIFNNDSLEMSFSLGNNVINKLKLYLKYNDNGIDKNIVFYINQKGD